MQSEIADAYDRLSYDFEHTVDTNSPYNADYERPAMLELLPGSLFGQAVLDAGCGAGWYADQLAKRGGRVTGVDISRKMVAAAKRRVGKSARILRHDLAAPLPFDHNSFDLIVSALVLDHIHDWGTTLHEFSRVLKPMGWLLLSVTHPFRIMSKSGPPKNYFEERAYTDIWNKPNSGEVSLSFYHRPLQVMIGEVTRYFTIDRIVEPQPLDSFKGKDLMRYERLNTTPHFLIIRARSAMSEQNLGVHDLGRLSRADIQMDIQPPSAAEDRVPKSSDVPGHKAELLKDNDHET